MREGVDKSPSATADDEWPVRAQYDWSETAPSIAVVETVAEATDRDPTSIEPLYDTLDPAGLDTLLRSGGSEGGRVDVTVSFAFAGHLVTVYRSGEVVLRPARKTHSADR